MYSNDDIKIIEKELKRFLLFFAIATAIFIVVLVAVCRNWGTTLDPVRLSSWPAYLVGIIYAVGTVFAWSLIGSKIIKYRKFVYSVLTGLEHDFKGKIVSIDKNIKYDNDLEFYSLEIKEDGAEGNRLLHLDATKDISAFKEGENVRLTIFGNYIKDVKS